MQKHILIALLCASLGVSARAQTAIPAPSGWTTQTKAGGAVTFTPPDLNAGEKYSVTVYDLAPLNGQTPEAYLRKFAGPVGTKPGQLAAPLDIKTVGAQTQSGFGVYTGPRGKALSVVFFAFAPDGANVFVSRTLFSQEELFLRYQEANGALLRSMGAFPSPSPSASAATSTPVQTSNEPLSAWTSQKSADDAVIYTPPDLRAGEVYRVTVSDTLRLKGRTVEEFLRDYAGPVGKKLGQLSAPLQVSNSYLRATATGASVGPGGGTLRVSFLGVTADGINIRVLRIVHGSYALMERYALPTRTLAEEMTARAEAEAGRNLVQVPERVSQSLKPGGELKPGVYVGKQYEAQALKFRLRLYLYDDGRYEFRSDDGLIYRSKWGNEVGTGKAGYDRNSGQLYLGSEFNMNNDSRTPTEDYCFYGINSEGKPAIISRDGGYGRPINTSLVWSGPIPPPPAPPKPTTAQLREIAKQKKQAADEAEAKRYKWVTAPGKGVKTAQIQAILHGSEGFGASMTDTLYLLLRDGTVRRDLPVAPDELNVLLSRQKEPKQWGKWRKKGNDYQVSWAGKAWVELPGLPVVPARANQKLDGYYGWAITNGAGSSNVSSVSWGTRYGINGRFEDSSSSLSVITSANAFAPGMVARSDDNGSSVMGAGPGYAFGGDSVKNNPLGDRQGIYSINGYVMTLRYDSGQIVRRPFFFLDKTRENLWDGGRFVYRDDSK